MKKYSFAIIFLILIVSLNYTIQNRWKGEKWKMTIGADGYGYYGYLPGIFIYHTLDFTKVEEAEQKIIPGSGGPFQFDENKLIDKCFIGEAILLAPFFLIAYALSYISGSGTGGYEFLFQASVSIGALFYLGVGLLCIRRLLKEYAISEFVISLTLVLLVFGTNLLYYATIEPSMSHVYSFGIMAVFLFYSKRVINQLTFKNLAWVAATISVLALIRPTNLLVLGAIPFLVGSIKVCSGFIMKLFSNRKIIPAFFISIGILLIQVAIWKLTTGHFFFWSYPGESFNFMRPHFLDILFSYRKGWFVYTPIMLVAVFGGLIVLYRQNCFLFSTALLFSILVIYVFSSWGTWTYEGDFGLRAFVDFYAFFAILLAIFLNAIATVWLKIPVILAGILCVALNLFQMYQYTHWIMPCARMDKDKYWKIFLKSDVSYQGIFDYPDTTGFNVLSSYHYTNDFEHNTWGNDENITTEHAHSGTHSAVVDSLHQIAPQLSLKVPVLPQAQPLFVLVKLWVYVPNMDNSVSLLVCIKPKKGDCYLWQPKSLRGYIFHKDQWEQAYNLVQLPAFKDSTDEVNITVFDPKGKVYIDDMDVIFETPK